MKKLLMMTTTIVILLGGAARAEVVLEKGTVGLSFGVISDAEVTLVEAGSQIAFSTGNFGFQVDGALNMLTDFSSFNSFGAYGLHFYKTTANGGKFGAYLNASSFLTQAGAEAMISIGDLDIEGSIGVLAVDFISNNVYNAQVDVYYTLSPNFEVSAGYNYYFEENNSNGFFRVGGAYMFPNSDLAITAGYRETFDVGVVDLGVTWSFGGNQDMRLFNNHNIDIFMYGGL